MVPLKSNLLVEVHKDKRFYKKLVDYVIEITIIDIMNKVKQLRSKIGLTQTQLASRLGLSFPSIIKWEGGAKVKPHILELLERISRDKKPSEVPNHSKEYY